MGNVKWWAVVTLVVLLALGMTLGSCQSKPEPVAGGTTNLDALVLSGNLSVGGNVTASGSSSSGPLRVVGATAVATATPALRVDSAGAGNALEIRNFSSTPVAVFQVNRSGNTTIGGTLGVTGGGTFTGAHQVNNAVQIAPTPNATATPGLYINNTSVAASSLVIADAATKVAEVTNAGAWFLGTDGAGVDFTWYSATSGDYMMWDASDEVLKIEGTNAQTALNVSDGNVVINDNLTVTAGNFDVTAGATTLEALTVGADGAGAAVTFHSATAGDNMAWSAANKRLTITGTDATTALDVADGNVVIDDNLTVTTGLSTLTGGVSVPLGVENLRLPSIITAAVTFESSGAIFTIPDGEIWFIHDVLVKVGTNFDCSNPDCTVVIGDGTDPNGLIDLVDAELQAAETEVAGGAAGWMGQLSGTKGAYLANGNFVYAPSGAAETIDITVGGTTPSAGAATVYLIYTRIQ